MSQVKPKLLKFVQMDECVVVHLALTTSRTYCIKSVT